MCSINRRLFQAWRDGDEAARNRIWKMVYNRLSTWAKGMFDEDIVSEGFLKSLYELDKNKNQLDWLGESSFVKYVKKLIWYRCQDIIRREGRRRITCFSALLPDEVEDNEDDSQEELLIDQTAPPPDTMTISTDQIRRFWDCVRRAKLPKAIREVLAVLFNLQDDLRIQGHDLGDLDHGEFLAELQSRLDIPPGPLYIRMTRFRKAVQRCINILRE